MHVQPVKVEGERERERERCPRTGDNGEVRLVTPLVWPVTQLSSQFDNGSQLSAIRRLFRYKIRK